MSALSTETHAPIRFLDLQPGYHKLRDELAHALLEVVESQQFILGPAVHSFESAISAYVNANEAISCASGSDALILALLALNIGPGDEVITTPFTFFATAGAIARTGATPVFADIDPATFNIDVLQVENKVTSKTRAIIAVHLFGLMADCDALMKIAERHGIAVIEDAAQAIGATSRGRFAGTIGAAGCFSFFPSKNLGGAGDGGMVVTNERAIAEKVRLLRVHGSRQKYHHEVVGMNSRLDSLQAAILEVKLRYLEEWTIKRVEKASYYRDLFCGLDLVSDDIAIPQAPPDGRHVFNQYVIRARKRDALRNFLASRGISTEVYYPKPLHLQQALSYLNYREGDLVHAETASREVLALPMYPELPEDQQVLIAYTIRDFYSSKEQ